MKSWKSAEWRRKKNFPKKYGRTKSEIREFIRNKKMWNRSKFHLRSMRLLRYRMQETIRYPYDDWCSYEYKIEKLRLSENQDD